MKFLDLIFFRSKYCAGLKYNFGTFATFFECSNSKTKLLFIEMEHQKEKNPFSSIGIQTRTFQLTSSCQSNTCLTEVLELTTLVQFAANAMCDFAEGTTTVATNNITLSLYTQMSMGGNCFSYSPELQGPSSGQFVYSFVPPLFRSTEEVE